MGEKLTRPDRNWLSYLSMREGMYNPYTAPKARSRFRRRMARLVAASLVTHDERNAYDALRGGLYEITPAGRAAISKETDQ